MTNDARFRIVPVAANLAQAVRRSRLDANDNPVVVVDDGRPHQCRLCLRLSEADERVLLMAYSPFATRQPYAETGPVFIHERECAPYTAQHRYPPEFPRTAVVLRAYDPEDRIVGAEAVGGRGVEEVIAEMFGAQDAAYLHARNLAYGCYMFRIERG